MIDERNNTHRTYCKRSRPLPYCIQLSRSPRHWKFTQHRRITPRVARMPTIKYECVCVTMCVCVCVYSNSRNDVPRMAQRYGTIAAHTRRRASVLVLFVVFCVHMHSFAGLIRRTPPPTFSDTAITDRHSDTTIFQLRAHQVRIFWCIGSEKIVLGHVPPVGVEPSTSCVQGEHPIH